MIKFVLGKFHTLHVEHSVYGHLNPPKPPSLSLVLLCPSFSWSSISQFCSCLLCVLVILTRTHQCGLRFGTEVRWNLTVLSISAYVITSEGEHLSIGLLAIYTSSFENGLCFISSFVFFVCFLIFVYSRYQFSHIYILKGFYFISWTVFSLYDLFHLLCTIF